MAEALLKQDMGKHIQLGISQVSQNRDGSLLIRWGYNNKGTNPVNMSCATDYLEVTKGSALFLRDVPEQLRCGYHMGDFEMVMIGDTELSWNWFGHKAIWNSAVLERLPCLV